jgi:L-ascorbate metabolism protein UlaG (beta-lactamase superfamily)
MLHDHMERSMKRRRFLKRALGSLALLGIGTGAGGGYYSAVNPYYGGPITDHFDGTRFFVPGRPQVGSPFNMLKWQFGKDPRATWPAEIKSPFLDEPPQRFEASGIRSTLIGHASFLLQVVGLNILIDPVYSERVSPVSFAGPMRHNAPGIAFEKLPPVDVVLVSHGHYDHLDTATLGRLHQAHRPRFICPLANDAVMASHIGGQQNAQALDWGQSVDVGKGATIHSVPSYHWSARGVLDRRKTLWCSFVITTPSGTIYHVADTGYGDGAFSKNVAKQFGPIALAHLPIGAYEPRWFMKTQHVNPEEAVQIFQDCGAAKAIGHHWGTFQLTNEAHDQPEKDLATALAAATVPAEQFQAFRPGQVLTLR